MWLAIGFALGLASASLQLTSRPRTKSGRLLLVAVICAIGVAIYLAVPFDGYSSPRAHLTIGYGSAAPLIVAFALVGARRRRRA
jgi:hypothetical protein